MTILFDADTISCLSADWRRMSLTAVGLLHCLICISDVGTDTAGSGQPPTAQRSGQQPQNVGWPVVNHFAPVVH